MKDKGFEVLALTLLPKAWVGGTIRECTMYEYCTSELDITRDADSLSVFSTVRGPRRARRGDCQEPWTGRDGKTRSTPVPETSGRPSLWRTAGPAR